MHKERTLKNKQSFYIIVGNVVYLAAQWALTVVVVRLSSDYYMAGLLALAMTITNIFYIIASYGLRAYQVSDITGKYSDQCYILSRIVTIAASLVAFAGYVAVLGYDATTLRVISLYMLYKVLEAASDVLYGIFQAHDRYDYVCTSMSVKGFLGILVFTGCLAAGLSLEAALCAMILVAVLTLAFLDVRWCLQYTRPLVYWSRTAWKSMLHLLWSSALMVLLLISQPLLISMPRLYFEQHYSTELLGIYSSLSAPTLIISTFVSCAMMPYIPLFAQYHAAGEKRRLAKLTAGSLLFAAGFGVLALAVASWLGEWVLVLLYGQDIAAYTHVFLLVIIVTTLSAVAMCLSTLFIALRRLVTLSVVLLTSCALCQLVTPYFVQGYGMEGVTYALMSALAFQILAGVLMAVLHIHKIPDRMNFTHGG